MGKQKMSVFGFVVIIIALLAITIYASSISKNNSHFITNNIFAKYNISLNLTNLSKNTIINNKANGTEIYNCPAVFSNPSKNTILAYINETGQPGAYGYCAVAALRIYNKTKLLAKYGLNTYSVSKIIDSVAKSSFIATVTPKLTIIHGAANITKLQQKAASILHNETINTNTSSVGSSKTSSTVSDYYNSYNWAGYIVTSILPSTEEVNGSWIVQTAGPSSQTTYSSQWVGIGNSDPGLIQTGTESDNISGQTQYYAWVEWLPNPQYPLSAPVFPGDHVWAEVYLVASNEWNITIVDLTQHWESTGIFSYNSTQNTAEWIDERTQINGVYPNLTNFGIAYYGQDYTGVSNTNYEGDYYTGWKSIGNASPAEMIMLNDSSYPIAIPSGISSDGTSFQAYRLMGLININSTGKTIDKGQSTTLIATETGGSGIYAYSWYSDPTCIGTILGTTATYDATPNSTTTYCLEITDSVGNSANATYTINVNPLFNVSITTPNPVIDSGQNITLTAYATGGSGSYTAYKWYDGSSCGGVPVGNSSVYTTPALISNSTYCVKVTDSVNGSAVYITNIIVNPSLNVSVMTNSNKLDQGQSANLSSAINGGTSPYSYQWYQILNSVSNQSNESGGGGAAFITGANSPTYIFNTSTNTLPTGSSPPYRFGIQVTDSAETPATKVSPVINLTVYRDPTILLSVPPNSILDLGQSIAYNISAHNGVGPYAVNLMLSGNTVATNTVPYNSSSVLTYTPSQTGVLAFNVIAEDAGTSLPFMFNSTSNTIQVNSNPVVNITPASTSLDANQIENYTVSVNGGTGPFNIELYSITDNVPIGNVIISGPSQSNSISFTTQNAGIITYNAIATDYGTTTPFVFSSQSNAINVNPTLSEVHLTPIISNIDDGQNLTLTITAIGGTPPYKYYWYKGTTVNSSNLIQESST